jgi:hypothetical protein
MTWSSAHGGEHKDNEARAASVHIPELHFAVMYASPSAGNVNKRQFTPAGNDGEPGQSANSSDGRSQ